MVVSAGIWRPCLASGASACARSAASWAARAFSESAPRSLFHHCAIEICVIPRNPCAPIFDRPAAHPLVELREEVHRILAAIEVGGIEATPIIVRNETAVEVQMLIEPFGEVPRQTTSQQSHPCLQDQLLSRALMNGASLKTYCIDERIGVNENDAPVRTTKPSKTSPINSSRPPAGARSPRRNLIRSSAQTLMTPHPCDDSSRKVRLPYWQGSSSEPFAFYAGPQPTVWSFFLWVGHHPPGSPLAWDPVPKPPVR